MSTILVGSCWARIYFAKLPDGRRGDALTFVRAFRMSRVAGLMLSAGQRREVDFSRHVEIEVSKL
jgi:hypothetical protein